MGSEEGSEIKGKQIAREEERKRRQKKDSEEKEKERNREGEVETFRNNGQQSEEVDKTIENQGKK
jgi:hypothetical protein